MNIDDQIAWLKSHIRHAKKLRDDRVRDGRMSIERAHFLIAAPQATLETLTQLRGLVLRADLTRPAASGAEPVVGADTPGLISKSPLEDEMQRRGVLAADFEVSTSVTKAVGHRPVTSFSVIQLRDSRPEPGHPVLKVDLEAELTPPEKQVLADLLLSVARRTRPCSDRKAS